MSPRSRLWLTVALAWGAGLAVIGVAASAVIWIGLFNVTASTPHPPLIAWATHTTMRSAVRRAAARMPPPPRFTPQDVQTGLLLYEAHCAVCHGGPGQARAVWVDGMTPAPPFLIDASQRWRPNEVYRIVRYGVRMTGMPAWDQTLSEADVWRIVAFVEAMPRYSAADLANGAARR